MKTSKARTSIEQLPRQVESPAVSYAYFYFGGLSPPTSLSDCVSGWQSWRPAFQWRWARFGAAARRSETGCVGDRGEMHAACAVRDRTITTIPHLSRPLLRQFLVGAFRLGSMDR